MRNLSQIPRHTVFYKFLAVNIAVLAVFYGITLYINSRIVKSQEKDIYQSSLNKLELFLNKLDADVTRQKQIQYQFADRFDLQKLSVAGNRLSDYDKVSIIQRIQSDVVNYKMMCEYCDNITVSIPSVERTISVRPILDYFEGTVDEDPPSLPDQEPPLTYQDNMLYSIFRFPKPTANHGDALYSIRVDIAHERIQQDMSTYFHENAENAILLAADGSWHLSTVEKIPEKIAGHFVGRQSSLIQGNGDFLKMDFNGNRQWLVYRYSKVLDAFFISYRLERSITEPFNSSNVTIWIVSAFTLLMVLFSIFWIRRFFDEPMSQLMSALGRVEKGDLKMNIRYNRDDEFHYVYERFNRMVVELNRLIELNYEQLIRAQQAELKQLQYHIKPHFLYNSIFLIYRMARDQDLETIEDFSLTLGNYYRYITRIQNQTIPFEREVGHIKNYVKIQSTRFGDRIVVNMDPIPEGLTNEPVLPLMLQPIVENAYHHGLSMVESNGRIDITMAVIGDMLRVTVDDSGNGMTAEELEAFSGKMMQNNVAQSNSGLSNVHHRLRIHFGPDSGLKLEPSPLGGLRVTLNLKLGVNQT